MCSSDLALIEAQEPCPSLKQICRDIDTSEAGSSEILYGLRSRGLLTHRMVQRGQERFVILCDPATGRETPPPPLNSRANWSPPTVSVTEEILRLRAAKMKHRDIAAALGMSRTAVIARVARAGVDRRKGAPGAAIGLNESPVGRRPAESEWPVGARFEDVPQHVIDAEAERIRGERLPVKQYRYAGSETGNAGYRCTEN